MSMELTDTAAALLGNPRGWRGHMDPGWTEMARELIEAIAQADRVSNLWSGHADLHYDMQPGDTFVIPLMTASGESQARDWVRISYPAYAGALYVIDSAPALPLFDSQWIVSGRFQVTEVAGTRSWRSVIKIPGKPTVVRLRYIGECSIQGHEAARRSPTSAEHG